MNERARRAPSGFDPGGPLPKSDGGGVVAGEGETLSYLAGHFRILQLQRGNRWSLDELVTAHVASAYSPQTLLDLGTGIGSVLLLLAWKFPAMEGIGVEAQEVSAALAERSIRYDDCEARLRVVRSDLRDSSLFAPGHRFDLVTGTPPYFPPGTGLESTTPQCAPARFEHRGGVEAYAEASARWLAKDGRFVMCGAFIEEARMLDAVRASRLAPEHLLRVIPKAGKGPRVVVLTSRHADAASNSHEASPTIDELVVRDEADRWTEQFRVVRRNFGMPD